MANMGYCRFENTYSDMMDCYYNINNNLSEREHKYREKILELCEQMISEFDENNLVDEEEE
jgi:hypothetical protein